MKRHAKYSSSGDEKQSETCSPFSVVYETVSNGREKRDDILSDDEKFVVVRRRLQFFAELSCVDKMSFGVFLDYPFFLFSQFQQTRLSLSMAEKKCSITPCRRERE